MSCGKIAKLTISGWTPHHMHCAIIHQRTPTNVIQFERFFVYIKYDGTFPPMVSLFFSFILIYFSSFLSFLSCNLCACDCIVIIEMFYSTSLYNKNEKPNNIILKRSDNTQNRKSSTEY